MAENGLVSDWSPTQYLKFADERTRAARDLLAQVPLASARRVYDLGCGPGNSTSLLVDRYPGARITGIDNSPAMIEAAHCALPHSDFEQADLRFWQPGDGPELLFSNATFQWVPDHIAVLERLLSGLTKGAVLAVQMPDAFGEPSHRMMAMAAAREPWAGILPDAAGARDGIASPREYYARLKPHCARFDIWHTIYNHPLDGVSGIVEWLRGTGLRPYLDHLPPNRREAFLADYRSLIADAYPELDGGKILLRFPRLFFVAVR